MRICGFKVYGAKTPMQVLLEAEKQAVIDETQKVTAKAQEVTD